MGENYRSRAAPLSAPCLQHKALGAQRAASLARNSTGTHATWHGGRAIVLPLRVAVGGQSEGHGAVASHLQPIENEMPAQAGNHECSENGNGRSVWSLTRSVKAIKQAPGVSHLQASAIETLGRER